MTFVPPCAARYRRRLAEVEPTFPTQARSLLRDARGRQFTRGRKLRLLFTREHSLRLALNPDGVRQPMRLIANGFVTDLPKGWEDRSMITLVGVAGTTGFVPNVVIVRQRVAPQTNIEAYAREQRAATEAEIEDLEIIDERAATVGGAPALQRLQRFSAQGRRLQQAQTYVLGDRVVFILTCTSALEQFNDHIAHFRRVVENFRLFNPEKAQL